MTKTFCIPGAAKTAAHKRWDAKPKHRCKRTIKVSCSLCGRNYRTIPKNVNPRYHNRYCSTCRQTPEAYPSAFKSETQRGEKNVKAKLTEAEVVSIRDLNGKGYTYHWLSYKYKVKQDTIYSICTRRSWKHVTRGCSRHDLQRTNKRCR